MSRERGTDSEPAPSCLLPPLPVQRELLESADEFLKILASNNLVEGIAGRPRVKDNPVLMPRLLMSLSRFHKAINPKKSKRGSPELRSLNTTSPFGKQHREDLHESVWELLEGLTAILEHWHISDFWGCTSFDFGHQIGESRSREDHVTFDLSAYWPNWPIPISRRVYDSMDYSVTQLAGCVSHVEQTIKERPDLFGHLSENPATGVPNVVDTSEKPRVIATRDKKLIERDKWIYEQCCKGTPHNQIVGKLGQIFAKRKWRKVSSKQSIQAIGKKYAADNGLDPPAPRRNL